MTKTIDALVEALEYWLPKAEPLPNTYDKVCEHHKNQWKKAVAALAQARAEQAEPFGYVSEHNCEGPFKLQFKKTLAEVYRDNFTTITPVYTTPPAAPVAKLEPWMVHARKLVQWRHCMSYNDSYFGESAGLLKHITTELERLMPEERLEAAHNAKLGGA